MLTIRIPNKVKARTPVSVSGEGKEVAELVLDLTTDWVLDADPTKWVLAPAQIIVLVTLARKRFGASVVVERF